MQFEERSKRRGEKRKGEEEREGRVTLQLFAFVVLLSPLLPPSPRVAPQAAAIVAREFQRGGGGTQRDGEEEWRWRHCAGLPEMQRAGAGQHKAPSAFGLRGRGQVQRAGERGAGRTAETETETAEEKRREEKEETGRREEDGFISRRAFPLFLS